MTAPLPGLARRAASPAPSTVSAASSSAGSSSGSGLVAGILAQPAAWVRAYDDFISHNSGQVGQIESALRSLTYIIPGRFRDAEIASEALHSAVQMLSLYHDALLRRAAVLCPSVTSSLSHMAPPPPHARYTRFWTERSPGYRRAAVLLQVVSYTQLLCEMAAKRRGGERTRWRVVLALEIVKAICRLVLLRITRGRALVMPPLPDRESVPATTAAGGGHHEGGNEPIRNEFANPFESEEEDRETMGEAEQRAEETAAARIARAAREKDWAMPRTGTTLPPLPDSRDIMPYLLSRVLTADDIRPAAALLNRLGGPARAAEVLHALAPLAYAAALAVSSSRHGDRGGRRSWAPWLIGFGVECASRQLRAAAEAAAAEDDHATSASARSTALEREEWTRRGWGLGWWAMRGPAYDGLVRGVVSGVRERVPSFVGGIIQDYEYLWENYHYATAG